MLERLLTRDEVAAMAQCSKERIDQVRKAGELPWIQLGKRLVRFRRDDVEAYLNKNRQK